MLKILQDFEIQTYHLIPAVTSELLIFNKRVLLECRVFNNTRKHYFHANTTKDLFENIHMDDVLSFLKETGLYQKI